MCKSCFRKCRFGKTPIFVGGTGLYFKALLTGIAGIPAIDPDIRARWNARLESEGVEALHAELSRADPQPRRG